MADYHQSEGNKFPPGWDCKYDSNTGKCYYINYLTKAMSLEDPRIKYQQLQVERMSNESIQMQPVHGSPYHVYPTSSYPAVQAFQAPIGFNVNNNNNNNNNSMTSSPLFMAKIQQQMEMSQVMRNGSPQSTRMMQQHQFTTTNKQNLQETSFITPAETDAAVAKINSMFPTASDSHIRLLLKKYYDREAVVISALQVEKHPLTTPGPFSTPPPPIRHNSTTFGGGGINTSYATTMTPPLGRLEQISRTGSPIPRPASANASTSAAGSYGGSPRVGDNAYRQSPKPHSSPKMKLRYLKSIFPKAEETLLLDILANAENNVQKASEQLKSMGYEKRDTTAPRLTNRQREAECMRVQREAENTPPPQPKLKTIEDKKQIKTQLQTLYKDVPGRIITMALESVDYSEERAIQILQIVMHQDEKDNKIGSNTIRNNTKSNASTAGNNKHTSTITSNGITPSMSSQSIKSAAKKLPSSSSPRTPPPLPPPSSSSLSSFITSKSAPPPQISHPSYQNLAQDASDVNSPTKKLLDSSSFPPSSDHHDVLFDADNNDNNNNNNNNKNKCSSISVSRKSNRNRLKTKTENLKASPTTTTDEIDSNSTSSSSPSSSTTTSNNMSEFKSVFDRIQTTGANSEIFNGPNEEILLADYIAWNGANPDLCCGGQRGLAIGSDKSLRNGRAAKLGNGPNKELYKGPKGGLAKGSIYSQIKCN